MGAHDFGNKKLNGGFGRNISLDRIGRIKKEREASLVAQW